jgi:hypothetical protein
MTMFGLYVRIIKERGENKINVSENYKHYFYGIFWSTSTSTWFSKNSISST